MNKYITTKSLRKTVVSTTLKSIEFNEANKYAKLGLVGTTAIFVFHKLSIKHYNKSLTLKSTTTKTGKIQLFSRKVREVVGAIECVGAIETTRFSLKILSMVH